MKLSPQSTKWLKSAEQLANVPNSKFITAVHILIALSRLDGSVAYRLMSENGCDWENVEKEIIELPPLAWENEAENPRIKTVLTMANEVAKSKGSEIIQTEHILQVLLADPDSTVIAILENSDIKTQAVIEALNESKEGVKDPTKSNKTPALDAFGDDLTEKAKKSILDVVIGREDELQQVIQTICRRTKNNPILVGEAGVGKTAIVEVLAQAIIACEVPEILTGKRVVMLDMARMVAGTKYRGQFEERLTAVMKEVKSNKNIILFIDEIHTIVGAGSASGTMDASNILKPALSRGEMQCIGATTLGEYKKYIETDSALARRFQKVQVEAPSIADTIKILHGLKPAYQKHHKCIFSDAAIEASAKMSDRYITDRFLPDKAIDLLDEAGSRTHMAGANTVAAKIKTQLAKLAESKEKALAKSEYENIAKITKKEENLNEKLKTAIAQLPTVGEKEIAIVLAKMRGIPVGQLTADESAKLLTMAEELEAKVIGQEKAVQAITRALRRARVDLKDPKRPIGSFLCLGPTGVGKTHLAKNLAEYMFGSADALIQIDMSEYMDKHNVSRLIGAPPGYVGYEEGGQLTELVRRNPYSVVLFDEVEKAHPDVMNIFLQILEEGKVTDSLGRKIDFRNTIILMTSNVGAEFLNKQTSLGFGATSPTIQNDEKLLEAAKKTFKPELLNRLTEIIPFCSLSKANLSQIVDLEMTKVLKKLEARNIKVVLSDEAQAFLIEKGYSLEYGARPMRRVIEQHVEDLLSEALLRGDIKDGSSFTLLLESGKVICKSNKPIKSITKKSEKHKESQV